MGENFVPGEMGDWIQHTWPLLQAHSPLPRVRDNDDDIVDDIDDDIDDDIENDNEEVKPV